MPPFHLKRGEIPKVRLRTREKEGQQGISMEHRGRLWTPLANLDERPEHAISLVFAVIPMDAVMHDEQSGRI